MSSRGLASGLALVGDVPDRTAGAAVPPMVLVAHPRAVPLSVDDGQIVAHFPPGRDGAHFPIRSRFNLSQHGARVFPDPNLEPDASPRSASATPRAARRGFEANLREAGPRLRVSGCSIASWLRETNLGLRSELDSQNRRSRPFISWRVALC